MISDEYVCVSLNLSLSVVGSSLCIAMQTCLSWWRNKWLSTIVLSNVNKWKKKIFGKMVMIAFYGDNCSAYSMALQYLSLKYSRNILRKQKCDTLLWTWLMNKSNTWPSKHCFLFVICWGFNQFGRLSDFELWSNQYLKRSIIYI